MEFALGNMDMIYGLSSKPMVWQPKDQIRSIAWFFKQKS